jgi:hypothetical protein
VLLIVDHELIIPLLVDACQGAVFLALELVGEAFDVSCLNFE